MIDFKSIIWAGDDESMRAAIETDGYRYEMRAWADGRFEATVYSPENIAIGVSEDTTGLDLEYAIEAAEGAALALEQDVALPLVTPPPPLVVWASSRLAGYFAEAGDVLLSVWYAGAGSWSYTVESLAVRMVCYSGAEMSKDAAKQAAERAATDDPEGWLEQFRRETEAA